MKSLTKSSTSDLYRDVFWIALPLIFSLGLGNILEVIDLTVSSLIDFEISKAISFLERFRFVFGAILIGFTSTLSMYLNRLIPHNDENRLVQIFGTITKITQYLGVAFSVGFGIFILIFSKQGSPVQIYGIGTALNIFFMYASIPLYIALTCTKRTGLILKVGVIATVANAAGTWFFGKHLGLGTIGIIAPTVLANAVSFYFMRKEAMDISFVRPKARIFTSRMREILGFAKENTIGSLVICLSELALVIVALKLGEVGVLYGMFFALEKLFNSVTHATSNAAAIPFSERLHVDAAKVALRPFYGMAIINSLIVTSLSIISLSFYQRYLSLGPYVALIVGIVFLNSLDYFLRKVILRPGGDARWTRIIKMYVIALANFVIAATVWWMTDQHLAAQILFYALFLQALLSAALVIQRVASRKWYHAL